MYICKVICHTHFLQVLLLGLHELENPKNIERLKKDLKVSELFKCICLLAASDKCSFITLVDQNIKSIVMISVMILILVVPINFPGLCYIIITIIY